MMRALGLSISEEVAVRIESISRTVKTVCRLNSVENLLLVVRKALPSAGQQPALAQRYAMDRPTVGARNELIDTIAPTVADGIKHAIAPSSMLSRPIGSV